MPPKFDFSKAKRKSPISTVRSRGVTAEDVQASRRSLEGVYHVKKISPVRVKEHQRILKRWGLYVKDLDDPAIPAEPKFGADFQFYSGHQELYSMVGELDERRFWGVRLRPHDQGLLLDLDSCLAYLNSTEFRDQCRLTTKAREKPVASIVDAQLLIDECWLSHHLFGSNRFRVSMAYVINLEAITSQRPGAIVESSSHAGSNEALTWGDHEFYIVLNKDNPSRPGYFLFITFRLLKYHRDDESKSTTVVLYYDPSEKMGHSAVLQAFILAFSEGIVFGIDQPSDIFEPRSPPSEITKLELKEEWKGRPVIRARERDGALWKVKEDAALSYPSYYKILQAIAENAGFLLKYLSFAYHNYGTSNTTSLATKS